MSSMNKNYAASLRNSGNILFRQAFPTIPDGTNSKFIAAPSLRIHKAQEAIKMYTEASHMASTEGNSLEWLSSIKNKGMTALRLAEFSGFRERNATTEVIQTYRTSLESFSDALFYGKGCKDFKWCDELALKINSVIESAKDFIIEQNDEWQQRCNLLESLITDNERTALAHSFVHFAIYGEMWKVVVNSDECSEWRTELYMIGEMYRPITIVTSCLMRLSDNYSAIQLLRGDVEDMEKSKRKYLCRAESTQHLTLANDLCSTLLFENEELNMDLAYIAIDHFTASILASKQFRDTQCCESEAKAASALGEMYEKVLKMHDKAHQMFLHAIQLADTITHTDGSTFFHQQWFQIAKKSVEDYRLKRLAFDQAEIAKQREPILIILKPKLDAIDTAVDKFSSKANRAIALLNHIYEHCPPKCAHKKPKDMKDDDNNAMKKILLKATAHYHTDKSYNKTEGMEWYILCQEIMTRINDSFEYYKGC